MNRIKQNWLDERGDSQLDSAIELILAEPIDNQAVERVAQRALELEESADRNLDIAPILHKVPRPHRWLQYSGGIASLAASVIILIWLTGGFDRSAFAQIVEKMKAIASVRFATKFQFGTRDAVSGLMLVKDDTLRYEQASLVQLTDTKLQKVLVLDNSNRTFQRLEIGQPGLPPIVNPIAELVAANEKAIKNLGSDRLNGKRVDVYLVSGLKLMGISGEGEMTLWADSETHLPVKIEMRDSDPKHKSILTFEQFDWNASLAPELFAMDTPPNYSAGKIFLTDVETTVVQPANIVQDLARGVLFSGRVPSRIEIDRERKLLTALLRDSETTPTQSNRPNELRQWDLASGKIRWTEVVGGAGDVATSSPHDLLALVQGQEIQIRQLSTGKVIRSWESPHELGAVAINRDATRLAHGYIIWGKNNQIAIGGIALWNMTTGKLEHEWKDLDRVDSLRFSPTNELLAVGSAIGTVKLFDSVTNALEHSLVGGPCADFSSDGKQLAFSSSETSNDGKIGRVDIVSLESKQLIRTLTMSEGRGNSYLLSVKFSPDDKRLAAADWNGNIAVWDLETSTLVPGLRPAAGGVHSVCFTGLDQVAAGSEDGVLILQSLGQ